MHRFLVENDDFLKRNYKENVLNSGYSVGMLSQITSAAVYSPRGSGSSYHELSYVVKLNLTHGIIARMDVIDVQLSYGFTNA